MEVYLGIDVGSGKDIQPLVVFQGGVAFNRGIVRVLREALDTEIMVPPHHEVMGAIGAALLAHESMVSSRNGSQFKGFGVSEIEYQTSSFECRACPSLCEIVQVSVDGQVLNSWGGHCDMWADSLVSGAQLRDR